MTTDRPDDPRKFTEYRVVDGVWQGANACGRCHKWLPPYMAAVPADAADEYCWGHEIEDATTPLLAELVPLRKLRDGVVGYLMTEEDGCPYEFHDGDRDVPDPECPGVWCFLTNAVAESLS